MIKHTLALTLALTACPGSQPKDDPPPAEADPAMDAADQALADKLDGRWDARVDNDSSTWSRYDFRADTYMIYDYEGTGAEGPVATYYHSWLVHRGAVLARFPDNHAPIEACFVLGDFVDEDHFNALPGKRVGAGCRPSPGVVMRFQRTAE